MFCIPLALDNSQGNQSHTLLQVHMGGGGGWEMLNLSPLMVLMHASLITPLIVPMLALLLVHRWKLYLDHSMVLINSILIIKSMVPMMSLL